MYISVRVNTCICSDLHHLLNAVFAKCPSLYVKLIQVLFFVFDAISKMFYFTVSVMPRHQKAFNVDNVRVNKIMVSYKIMEFITKSLILVVYVTYTVMKNFSS